MGNSGELCCQRDRPGPQVCDEHDRNIRYPVRICRHIHRHLPQREVTRKHEKRKPTNKILIVYILLKSSFFWFTVEVFSSLYHIYFSAGKWWLRTSSFSNQTSFSVGFPKFIYIFFLFYINVHIRRRWEIYSFLYQGDLNCEITNKVWIWG